MYSTTGIFRIEESNSYCSSLKINKTNVDLAAVNVRDCMYNK